MGISEIQRDMATLYIACHPTIIGSLGGVWGFFDCGIFGVLIACPHNKFITA